MMVIPNLMGVSIWSPNLDEFGNSVRGIEFANKLTEQFNFHNFDSLIGQCTKINPRKKTSQFKSDT
jgi:glutaminase